MSERSSDDRTEKGLIDEMNGKDTFTDKGRRQIDWDVRGILAILALSGAFALAFVQLLIGPANSAEIPAWAAAIVSGVTGFYFGSHGDSSSR